MHITLPDKMLLFSFSFHNYRPHAQLSSYTSLDSLLIRRKVAVLYAQPTFHEEVTSVLACILYDLGRIVSKVKRFRLLSVASDCTYFLQVSMSLFTLEMGYMLGVYCCLLASEGNVALINFMVRSILISETEDYIYG